MSGDRGSVPQLTPGVSSTHVLLGDTVMKIREGKAELLGETALAQGGSGGQRTFSALGFPKGMKCWEEEPITEDLLSKWNHGPVLVITFTLVGDLYSSPECNVRTVLPTSTCSRPEHNPKLPPRPAPSVTGSLPQLSLCYHFIDFQ